MQSLRKLLQSIPHQIQQGADLQDINISGVTHDSRLVRPGNLFVAFSGQSFDGHLFFEEVADQGVAALLGQKSLSELSSQGISIPEQLPYYKVANSRKSMAHLAAAFHGFPSRALIVIGITGTDGKTSTANILESILATATQSGAYPNGRVGVISTVGARMCGRESDTGLHVTTPDAPAIQQYLAKMRDAGCLYAIIESTSMGIAQFRVDAIDFDVAAVTNITHEHIDWHGSRSAYIDAKADLFRMLFRNQSGKIESCQAILNVDDRGDADCPGSFDALLAVLMKEAVRATKDTRPITFRSYGIVQSVSNREGSQETRVQESQCQDTQGRPTVWPTGLEFQPDRTRFDLHYPSGVFPIESHLIGDFNVQNILCAATIALSLGISPRSIQVGTLRMKGVLGRMERIDCGQPFLALVDFAHSPASLERALLTLRRLLVSSTPSGSQQNRLIALFGSAGLRDVEKRRLMGQVSGQLADFTIITAEDPRTEDLDEINCTIAAGVLESTTEQHFMIIPDRTEAIFQAVKMARPGDIVASFGKGHERSMCYGTTEYPWNEQAVLQNALHALGFSKGSDGSI
ncbi:MAG: UDP-N-acetylmuramoyl-L-alanyl-D-glutamate--2,6-diaminopimelate ligase [Chloroflexota bacterium]